MNNKKLIYFLLAVLVLFLFSYSIYGTAVFLNINFNNNDSMIENKEELQEKEKSNLLTIKGNTSGNLSQCYQDNVSDKRDNNGGMIISNEYIYKTQKINDKYIINKINIETGDSFPILSGYNCRNLLLLNNYIFCIVETQNDQDIICEKIAKISIDGNEIVFFDSTESQEITSMLSDGDEIYYTKKDNNYIYKINLSGSIYTYIYKITEKSKNPYLFGLNKGKLYYVDGYEMASINLTNYSKEHISYQFCNIKQNPILEDNKIFVFKDLVKSELVYIDLENNENISIFSINDLTKFNITSSNITNINYYKNIIFFNFNNEVYYINIDTKQINKIAGITSYSKVLYFNNNYIYTEVEKYGNVQKNAIAYVLVQ
jgi:hypothetical protein